MTSLFRCMPKWFSLTSISEQTPILADEQQAGGLAGQRQRSAVDAGRHRAVGVLDGDAPQVAQTEGIGPCPRQRSGVQVVEVRREELQKAGIVRAAVDPQEFGAGLAIVYAPLRLVVAQSLGGGPDVRAQPGVRRRRVGGSSPSAGRTGCHRVMIRPVAKL